MEGHGCSKDVGACVYVHVGVMRDWVDTVVYKHYQKLQRDHENNLNKVDVLFRSDKYKQEGEHRIVGVGWRQRRLELFSLHRP